MLFAFFTLSRSALAANSHDHLYSLPTAAAFAKNSSAIFALPRRSQVLSRFFSTKDGTEPLYQFLIQPGGVSPEKARKFVEHGGLQRTLQEVCLLVDPRSPSKALAKILELRAPASAFVVDGVSRTREAYVQVENIRRSLLLSISEETFEEIFRSYFSRETHINRSELMLSVPSQFYQGDQRGKLRRLRALAIQKKDGKRRTAPS